uniref:Mitogen-activated protein kinase 6 n=1 Tax=Rousettus aegyptiacus TaxID=9407 RepID=A0A7J8INE8_ROUAE|nr:mitogen-activated protein kinase 6 [Rousettus aegyptiacus]
MSQYQTILFILKMKLMIFCLWMKLIVIFITGKGTTIANFQSMIGLYITTLILMKFSLTQELCLMSLMKKKYKSILENTWMEIAKSIWRILLLIPITLLSLVGSTQIIMKTNIVIWSVAILVTTK